MDSSIGAHINGPFIFPLYHHTIKNSTIKKWLSCIWEEILLQKAIFIYNNLWFWLHAQWYPIFSTIIIIKLVYLRISLAIVSIYLRDYSLVGNNPSFLLNFGLQGYMGTILSQPKDKIRVITSWHRCRGERIQILPWKNDSFQEE